MGLGESVDENRCLRMLLSITIPLPGMGATPLTVHMMVVEPASVTLQNTLTPRVDVGTVSSKPTPIFTMLGSVDSMGRNAMIPAEMKE